jgi:hypothetical protein
MLQVAGHEDFLRVAISREQPEKQQRQELAP